MTDFYVQLERQLVEAGHRRARRGWVARAVAGRGRPLLAAATVVLALVAVAALVPALRSGTSSDPGGSAAPSAPPASSPPAPATPPSAAVADPSLRGVQVALLNATTTTGLARRVAEVLARHGATIGAIGTDVDQQRAQSVVDHRPGAQAQARLVADVLGIRAIRVLPQGQAALAAGATTVVVRLGADHSGG